MCCRVISHLCSFERRISREKEKRQQQGRRERENDSQESSLTPQSKSINLWRSAFFIFQLSRPYMAPGKTIALTIQTFVSKVMFLLFNMLSRFVIAFLPRDRHLLISRLHSLSVVILEPRKIKSVPANISISCNFNEEVRLPSVTSYPK